MNILVENIESYSDDHLSDELVSVLRDNNVQINKTSNLSAYSLLNRKLLSRVVMLKEKYSVVKGEKGNRSDFIKHLESDLVAFFYRNCRESYKTEKSYNLDYLDAIEHFINKLFRLMELPTKIVSSQNNNESEQSSLRRFIKKKLTQLDS